MLLELAEDDYAKFKFSVCKELKQKSRKNYHGKVESSKSRNENFQ
jgi:hypothetical protein